MRIAKDKRHHQLQIHADRQGDKMIEMTRFASEAYLGQPPRRSRGLSGVGDANYKVWGRSWGLLGYPRPLSECLQRR
jgi:hypothetical protein